MRGTHDVVETAVGGAVASAAEIQQVQRTARAISENVQRVINGKPQVITSALVTLFSEGHLLIEDVPGVGKTMLSKSLARSIDCSVRRLQFTPDMLPSDVTGVSVYNEHTRTFEFRPGGIFANIVVGDEINRASPKTQSALLESMEEGHVSVDGTTYALEAPFMVIATQNPIEMQGTYALPEAQRDRFLAKVSVGYPSTEAEEQMLDAHTTTSPLESLRPVTSADEVRTLVDVVHRVHLSPAVRSYIVALVSGTRDHPDVTLGASPRASLHLGRAAKAYAAMCGRTHVVPEDVQALAPTVVAHRLVLRNDPHGTGHYSQDVVRQLVKAIPVPSVGHG